MRLYFLIDFDLQEVIGDEDISEEKLEKWFQVHKEEFALNMNEHARNEIKYFLRELHPIEG